MNIKQLETNLSNVKKYSPKIYKPSMKLTIPFFILHKKLYETGNDLLHKEFNLNQSELDILATLYYMTEGTFTMTPTQLYDEMMFSSGGMTKVLKKLELKEYIRRLDNKEDKRSKLVQLSEQGKSATKDALDRIVSFEDDTFSKLNDQEQDVLSQLLHKLLH